MFPSIVLFGEIQVPTYFFVLSLTCVLILFLTVKRANQLRVSQTEALDMLMIGLIVGLIGARLTHVFYEYPELYARDPLHVFYLWEGGYVYYGGLLSGILASLIFIRSKALPAGQWFDFFAPLLSLGYGLGRFACLFAGCCYGKQSDLPWSFPMGSLADGIRRHPTQLYAIFWELGVFFVLLGLEKSRRIHGSKNFLKNEGDLFCIWLALHSVGRLLMETFRDDFRGYAPFGLSISTHLSLALLAATGASWLRCRVWRN